jgi:hypothetical protein
MVTFCIFDSLRKTQNSNETKVLNAFIYLTQNSMMILTPLLNCKKKKKEKVLFSFTLTKLFANFVWAMQNFFLFARVFLKMKTLCSCYYLQIFCFIHFEIRG